MTTPVIGLGTAAMPMEPIEILEDRLQDLAVQLRSEDPPTRTDVASFVERLIPYARQANAIRDLVRRRPLAPLAETPPRPGVFTSLDVVRAAEAEAAPIAAAMATADRAIFRDNNPHDVDTVAPVGHAPINRGGLEADPLPMCSYLWGENRSDAGRMAFGPYGRSRRMLYAWPEGARVATGCFEGTIQEFREAVGRTYGDEIGNLRSYIASEAETPQSWDYLAVARLMHQRAEYLAIADLIDNLRLSRLEHPEV